MKTNLRSAACRIESLESRIAPSAVFPYTDVDGDAVTVTTSKGTDAQLAAIITPHLLLAGPLGGRQLQEIDFSSAPLDPAAGKSI